MCLLCCFVCFGFAFGIGVVGVLFGFGGVGCCGLGVSSDMCGFVYYRLLVWMVLWVVVLVWCLMTLWVVGLVLCLMFVWAFGFVCDTCLLFVLWWMDCLLFVVISGWVVLGLVVGGCLLWIGCVTLLGGFGLCCLDVLGLL